MTHTNNIYQMVTDRILEQMAKGIIPWKRPWGGAKISGENAAINYVTRRAYSPLNQWLLGQVGEYLSFKQVQALGGKVKKGAKARMVVFYTKAEFVKHNDETGEDELRCYPLLKYYNVFHLDDCEGIESKIVAGETCEVETDADADKVIAEYVAREDSLKFYNNKPSNKAYYAPAGDYVVVPMASQYTDIDEYYSTTFHELVHSTMTEKRCNRMAENKLAAFGSENYSREELVAEIGSAMLCSVTGHDTNKVFKNSVGYIQGWSKAFKKDNRMIVWAASRAEKAAKYIMNIKDEQ